MECYWKSQEQKDKLVKKINAVIDADILSDEEVIAILEICISACNRKKASLTEDYLIRSVGSDTGTEQ